MDSILTSVKKLLGITEEQTDFDTDIIIHINSVLMILNQIGIGPENGFTVSSKFETWDDFFEDGTVIEAVKTYIYLKVRLLFDPPASSGTIEAFNKSIAELEWRINLIAETANS